MSILMTYKKTITEILAMYHYSNRLPICSSSVGVDSFQAVGEVYLNEKFKILLNILWFITCISNSSRALEPNTAGNLRSAVTSRDIFLCMVHPQWFQIGSNFL